MYKKSYDLNRPWKEVMEELADDDIHEDFYKSANPLVAYIHRRRIEIIKNAILQESSRDLLEVGCGDGFVLEALSDLKISLTGIEISEKRIERAVHRVPTASIIQGDAKHLPFADNSFDLIVCSEVLEHIPEPKDAINEIKRVTKKNGTIIISVPNERNWRIGRALLFRFPVVIPDHVNSFSIGMMNKLFGMKPNKIHLLPPLGRLFNLSYVFIYTK